MDMIRAIADRHGLAVVEDACQAHGADVSRPQDRAASVTARSASTRTKNMTTGEGGLITTDDDRLADWLRLYRNQGMRGATTTRCSATTSG
jgi:perosamine synthetase